MVDEPLLESSAWLDAVAPWACRRDEAGGSCAWYHGTWQYLRLLGLVSTPAWHAAFFDNALRAALAGGATPSILVCGCADYGLYAHALAAVGDAAAFTVLDCCPTPLAATAWYARRAGAPPPELVCADATAHRPAGRYDAIATDAFLPRFPPEQLRGLLAAWRVALRPGGRAITTVRIHERVPRGRAEATAMHWAEAAQAAAAWWPGAAGLPADELPGRVAAFARRQERNAVYGVDELEVLFTQAGFAEVAVELAEHDSKTFARVVAG